MRRRLWEIEHPYYCEQGNYYARDETIQKYGSWADFIASEGDADMDLNLVFRWDWKRAEGASAQRAEADEYYRAETLELFFMGQRKGLYRSAEVKCLSRG